MLGPDILNIHAVWVDLRYWQATFRFDHMRFVGYAKYTLQKLPAEDRSKFWYDTFSLNEIFSNSSIRYILCFCATIDYSGTSFLNLL